MTLFMTLFKSLSFFLFFLPFAQAIPVQVTQVSDGDTVTITDQKKVDRVRLVGIDAPEKAQRFGTEATQNLKNLVLGREVDLQMIGRDKYGRILGDLYLVSGKETVHVNKVQLEGGLAWYYRHYAASLPPERQVEYDALETRAKANRSGLWIDPNPVPPWVFRNGPKQEEPPQEERLETSPLVIK